MVTALINKNNNWNSASVGVFPVTGYYAGGFSTTNIQQLGQFQTTRGHITMFEQNVNCVTEDADGAEII